MKQLSDEIIQFFQNQSFVVVSSVGPDGIPHTSCKGILEIDKAGLVYIFDLYQATTYANLKQNPRMNITAVDEHRFKGYCLKGRARIVSWKELNPKILKAWEDRITNRITQRVIKNIREEKGHPRHPEALLPKPKYMILMQVKEIIDLTPQHIREGV